MIENSREPFVRNFISGQSIALAEDSTVSAYGDYKGTLPTGLKGVAAIAAGGIHSLALLQNGTVVAWGAGNELGVTSVPNYLSNVTDIAAGSYRSLALGEILVHRATASLAYENGSVRSVMVLDGGYGYTNAPKVRIEGGGGTEAKALAVVEDGVVTSIQITAEGNGYGIQPTIRIASPNAPPVLAIRVATVFVDLNLIFGSTYQLHSSKDLIHWTPLGEPFTPENEHITKEFNATETGQYFRAEQLPRASPNKNFNSPRPGPRPSFPSLLLEMPDFPRLNAEMVLGRSLMFEEVEGFARICIHLIYLSR